MFFGACWMKMERVGLEACSLTAWLHTGLTEAGLPAICIETRQAKAAMGAMPNKTDRNDARGIAQIMRTGWYRAVHVNNPACRSWRALLPIHWCPVEELRPERCRIDSADHGQFETAARIRSRRSN